MSSHPSHLSHPVPSLSLRLSAARVQGVERFCIPQSESRVQLSAESVLLAIQDLRKDVEAWQEKLRVMLFPDINDRIKGVVADEFGVTVEAMMSKTRKPSLCFPRQVVFAMAMAFHDSTSVVGRIFKRDHGSIDHAVKSVRARIDTEPKVRAACERIAAKLEIPASAL